MTLPSQAPATIEFEIACVPGRDVRPVDSVASASDVIPQAHRVGDVAKLLAVRLDADEVAAPGTRVTASFLDSSLGLVVSASKQ